ncbi:putative FAD-binding PCMH-type domain-containing protein [Seiridium cardinale]|uniref:FAD-binding PCMH-type domain-containing protein n=1 Tax=Seiridium cardinale TaxID=138064 RepID=A0ABR2XQA6_9PEZI
MIILLYTKPSLHFQDAGKVWNLSNKARPLAIARCLSASAVQSVVAFCSGGPSPERRSQPRTPLGVHSGGHDPFNRSVFGGSLMLDVTGLDSIVISTDWKSATVGGDISSGVLINFLGEYGLITPSGYCNTVGYVGWSTGGYWRTRGGLWARSRSDSWRDTGRCNRAVDRYDDPELLWALRGAGTSNFGVVVSLRIRVYGWPAYLAGILLFPASEIDKVMIGLTRVIEEAGYSDTFSGDCSIAQVSCTSTSSGYTVFFIVLPNNMLIQLEVDAELRGSLYHLFSWVGHIDGGDGARDRGWQCLRNCEELGTVLVNTISRTTPADSMATLDPMTSMSMVAKLPAFTMAGLSSELASILASMVIAHRSHGCRYVSASNTQRRSGHETSSMPIRDPHTILAITGSALPDGEGGVSPLPGEFGKCVRWVDRSSNQIVKAGLDLPRTYVNWTSNEEADVVPLYGGNQQTVEEAESRYDSSNLFVSTYPNLT